jgi:hypothetical protein
MCLRRCRGEGLQCRRQSEGMPPVRNLYSMTTNQEAIRRLFRVDLDHTGNLPPMPGVYPDYAAPIVRNAAAGRELTLARWGMPTRPKFLEGKKSDPGVTNIHNATSSHWRPWLRLNRPSTRPTMCRATGSMMSIRSGPPNFLQRASAPCCRRAGSSVPFRKCPGDIACWHRCTIYHTASAVDLQ